MATTAEYLQAHFGVTMQQAHDFVLEHMNDPAGIYQLAYANGVTAAMLGEIAGGYSAGDVLAFFGSHGIDASPLSPDPVTYDVAQLTGLPGGVG